VILTSSSATENGTPWQGLLNVTVMILFNLQVTKDGCPVIFHDNFIYTEENVKAYCRLRSASSGALIICQADHNLSIHLSKIS